MLRPGVTTWIRIAVPCCSFPGTTGATAVNRQIDSRFLTTASAVRTIEALLGLQSNNLMTATAPLLFTALVRDRSQLHGPYQADFSNLENGRIFEEATGMIRDNPILRKLAKLTATLDMEEADQADANTLNYVLRGVGADPGQAALLSVGGRVDDLERG